MAILKGIEVSVVINGKALTEYNNEDTADESPDHPSEVSKYIEAVSDAEFAISITVPRSYEFMADAIALRLSLDGVWVRTYVCGKVRVQIEGKDWYSTMAGSKVKDGKYWYLKPFKFNGINIAEASTSTTGSGKRNSVAKLGTITLDVFDEEITGRNYNPSGKAIRLGQSSEITEKELKGRNVTLQAGFGENRSSERPVYVKSKTLNEKPIFSFEFKYRSKKALQVLRLIPMTPSPSPMPTPVPLEERPFDSLIPNEVQELARKLHAKYQAEREANIKPEKTKLERGVKKERDHEYEDMIKSSTAKRVKTRPFEQGEIIELD